MLHKVQKPFSENSFDQLRSNGEREVVIRSLGMCMAAAKFRSWERGMKLHQKDKTKNKCFIYDHL